MYAWSMPLLRRSCPGSLGVPANLLLFALTPLPHLILRQSRVTFYLTLHYVHVSLLPLACRLPLLLATHGGT